MNESEPNNELDSLEGSSTSYVTNTPPSASPSSEPPTPSAGNQANDELSQTSRQPQPRLPLKQSLQQRWTVLMQRANLYVLGLVLLFLVALAVSGVALQQNSKQSQAPKVDSQSLSSSTLKQIANSDVSVGDAKQVLNVQSNAVFAGKVLVRDSLEVAGPLHIGGDLSLSGISATGNSAFQQITVANNLGIGGNTTVQGQLTAQKGITVAGGGNFGGTVSASQLNTNSLLLNGDLSLTHHLNVAGGSVGRSNGAALGGGGTSSVSGADTAGTVTINTGSNPVPGCFITVNFTQRYAGSPHVMVTPVGAAAGAIGYYINRSSSSFSICSSTAAPSNSSFGFDYFVTG